MKERKNKGISIIGGTGFIGKHLINYLCKKNIDQIRALTRNEKTPFISNNITLIKGDLSSPSSIDKLIKNQEVVINLAYISENLEANINAIEVLVDSCIKAKISKLIHCSTAVVSGRVNEPIINEETICNPFNEYEKTKLVIEERLLDLTRNKIELIIIRPTAVFGPDGMNLVKTIHSNLYQSEIIKRNRIMLNKFRCTHLVPVEDVVKAIFFLTMIEKDLSGEKFIISRDDDQNNNYFYVANRIAILNNNKKIRKIFFPFAPFFLEKILKLLRKSQIKPNQTYSNKKLKKYGFTNSIDFEIAVDEFIKFNIK